MARKGLKFDPWLCGSVLCLTGLGVVLVASSSADFAASRHLPGSYYLVQHVKKVLIGFLAFLVGMILPYKTWERLARPMLIATIALLALLMGTGMGDRVHGARRWIQFASFGLQPSELAKLALIFYLARRLAEKAGDLQSFRRGLLAALPVPLIVFALILKQPNYSTAATVACITVALVFLAGCRVWHLLALGAVALPALGALMVSSAYRMRRVLAFVSPGANPAVAYQSQQALISLGHGGIFGTGLGSGTEKLGYLPMPFTDTVFSILGEELGFIGTLAVLLLFGLVVWRGLRIARRCPDRFGALVATGLSVSVAVNVIMHVGVCVKLFPVTGQTLPFISYGGTSLLANLFGMGVLLNISGEVAEASARESALGAPARKAAAAALLKGLPGRAVRPRPSFREART